MMCIRTFTRESALSLSFVGVLPHSDLADPLQINIRRPLERPYFLKR